MTTIRKLYHFLGGVYFAIILIASTALFVVAGTLIEALTESHRYAAYFTYNNPIFVVLLWGFFVNILLSATRRWPFKKRHIPFLITHLGLLMILTGTIAKSTFGLQGSMGIMEGSAKDEVFIADTYVLRVDKRDSGSIENPLTDYYPLKRKFNGQLDTNLSLSTQFPELQIQIVEYAPNSFERLESWIKGHWGFISGLKPFPVYEWLDLSKLQELPVSTRVHLKPDQQQPWDIFSGRTTDVAAAAKLIYSQSMTLKLTDTYTGEVLFTGPFQNNISWDSGSAAFNLDFSFSPINGFEDPHLLATLTFPNRAPEIIRVPLEGEESLKNINLLTSFFGNSPVSIDFQRIPSLAFLQDLHGDLFLFAFDSYGRVHVEPFRSDNLNSLIAYDNGFGGYAVQAKIPFGKSQSRDDTERVQLTAVSDQLRKGLQDSSVLSPPLSMLNDACKQAGIDFPTCCLNFLVAWNNSSSWLFPADFKLPPSVLLALKNLDWENIPKKERQACYWTHLLFKELEPRLKNGDNLLQILTERKWPLLPQLKALQPESDFCSSSMTATMLAMLTQQIFMVSDQLPDSKDPKIFSEGLKARLLSAHLRAHGIHLSNITRPEVIQEEYFTIECPLTSNRQNDIPQNKLEDNIPKITFQISDGSKTEWATLSYDRFGQGLKWPILNGQYTIRFQPNFIKIPYRVRLRNARQINYANSLQPYSYESDLIITDKNSNNTVEKTISMNNVHETWEGYRLYLSNISPSNETAVKRIQLIVNYDPAKYWLTYPGAFVLSLGVGLLFWYKRKK